MATQKSTKDLNHHARLDEDEANMHFPKQFLGANAGTVVWKDETENIAWIQLPVLPPVIDIVDGLSAPPTEIDKDVYVLDLAASSLDVDTILFQSGNTIRYTFNGSPDLSGIAVDYHMRIRGAGLSINDGTFIITDVNDGSDFIEITNVNREDNTDDEASDSPAVGTVTHKDWDETGDGDWVQFNENGVGVWDGITLNVGTTFYNETEGELQILTSTGFTNAANKWIKISKTFADFSIAGLEKDIQILSLPPGYESRVFVKHSEAFAGTGITGCETEVGITGELDKYMFEAFNVFQAVGDKIFTQEAINSVEDWGSVTSIRANMRSVGADLDQLSAGKIDYYLRIEQIKIP